METLVTIARPNRPTELNPNETDPDVIELHEVELDIYKE